MLPYKCSICPPLLTREMSNLAILAHSKTPKRFLIPCPRHVSLWLPPNGETCKYAVEARKQKKLGEIPHLLICSYLLCLSWLLCSWVRNFRRDLRNTLYTGVFSGIASFDSDIVHALPKAFCFFFFFFFLFCFVWLMFSCILLKVSILISKQMNCIGTCVPLNYRRRQNPAH